MSNIIVVNKYGERDKKRREDIYLDLTLKNKKYFLRNAWDHIEQIMNVILPCILKFLQYLHVIYYSTDNF
jgi:hypothetical protein